MQYTGDPSGLLSGQHAAAFRIGVDAQPTLPPEYPVYPSFESVAVPLLRDPMLMAHFKGENHKKEVSFDWGPVPEDPAHKACWEMAHMLEGCLAKRFGHAFALEQRQNRSAALQRKLDMLGRLDPLFKRTMDLVRHQLSSLHGPCKRATLRELDENPHAFMELYGELREMAQRVQHRAHARRAQQARRQSASKPDSEQQDASARQEAKQAVLKRLHSGQGTDDDIMRYLELCGVADRLDG